MIIKSDLVQTISFIQCCYLLDSESQIEKKQQTISFFK